MGTQARYGFALALLLTSYLLGSFNGTAVQFLVDMTYIALLAVLILDPRANRWMKAIGLAVVLLSALSSVVAVAVTPVNPTLATISSALNALVVGVAILVLIRRLASHSRVTASTVMGAVLVYALLGFMFASIYQAIGLSSPTPFFNQGQVPISDYSYFSFITLTTVGYGDLTPALEIVIRLVVIEALIAQVLLVGLVARLVSLWGHMTPWAKEQKIKNLAAAHTDAAAKLRKVALEADGDPAAVAPASDRDSQKPPDTGP